MDGKDDSARRAPNLREPNAHVHEAMMPGLVWLLLGFEGFMTDDKLRLNLLIVEDNKDIAESLCVLLTAWGHQCRVAHDGEQAVAKAREAVPDVVIMDLLMPRMDGFEAASALRAEPFGKGLKIIAISAWARLLQETLFHAAGFDHELLKPFNPQVLESLLSQHNRDKPDTAT